MSSEITLEEESASSSSTNGLNLITPEGTSPNVPLDLDSDEGHGAVQDPLSVGSTCAPSTSLDAPMKLQKLYEKHSAQQEELERLERQNGEYREQLIRIIRERDLNEELLKNVRSEQAATMDELEKRVMDLESQLKITKDRAAAQEAQYSTTTKDLMTKFNSQVAQLSRKCDISDREKNEAVVKYAMKEGEIMRLTADLKKKSEEAKRLSEEIEQLKASSSQEKFHELTRKNEELSVELEKIKHEKFDLDNRYKMSEKRAEATQFALNDVKQQVEVLRKQMLQLKEERSSLQEQCKRLTDDLKAKDGAQSQLDAESVKAMSEREEMYRNVMDEVSRSRSEISELTRKLREMEQEKESFQKTLTTTEDLLRIEKEQCRHAKQRMEELEGIERQVLGSRDDARRAVKAKEEAENDKITAETEAEECRRQAERMLKITEQLTQRNTQLSGELEKEREQNGVLRHKLVEAEGCLQRAQSKLDSVEKDTEMSSVALSAEVSSLREEVAEKSSKVRELQRQLADEKNENAVYKKKVTSNMKELKSEVSVLRKQLTQKAVSAAESEFIPPPTSSGAHSSGSRASSITSMDQVGKAPESVTSATSPTEECAPGVQAAMVEKIVKLQKQLARRTEKIEFLEEQVRQCIVELQKKTKIIQHYALREEASLLMPQDKDLEKVPLSKKGYSYLLMGSMWTNGQDKKSSLQLATEVNSRLQAVLEDTLLKNIALKTSLDTLGEEISRLSRENRQLSLAQR